MTPKKSTIIFAAVIALSLSAVFSVLYMFHLLQAPMEPVPIDAGWVGLFLMFVNGFSLSFILDRGKVGLLERLLLTVGLGFGSTFVVMILLGILWQLSLLSVLVVQISLLIPLTAVAVARGLRFKGAVVSAPQKSSRRVTKQTVVQASLLIIIFTLAFLAIYNALALPAVEWDSLAYGVNYAKIIFQNSHIPLIAGPSIGIEMSAPYPPGVQVTAASLYALAGNVNDFYYKLLSPIFGLTTLLITYKFAMRLNRNRTFSIYAVSALTLTPFFWELLANESYLMGLTLMLTLSAYFFYKAHGADASDVKKYEVIAVLFCGFAALTSYIGLFAFGILLLYALHKKPSVKRVFFLGALGFLVVAPWYLRNLILLRNPVYPFFGIGNYLDPLLRSSTVQHFQQYTLIPLYRWTTLSSEVGTVLLVVGIAFFTLYKPKKKFLIALSLYLLFISIVIMAFHVAFPRYIILSLPVLAVFFSTLIKSVPPTRKLPQVAAVIFVVLVVLVSAVMLPYTDSIKPLRESGENKWQYLARVLEEGDAWQWINQNTPANAKIATFDIKQYYLNRTVFALDGNESAPLYHMSTIQEGMKLLKESGVGYVLSVPWASPMDSRLPPAYTWCILTRYLGDPDYLPPVFVGRNGTAVYHVGPLEEATMNQAFAQKGMVTPIKHVSVNVAITNNTSPSMGKCYLPIPVDYRTGIITVSVNSLKPVDLEFWNGLILTDKIDSASENFMIAKSPYANATSIGPFSFQWHIDKAGYFTIRVIDKEEIFQGGFNVTLDIAFYNSWDLEST